MVLMEVDFNRINKFLFSNRYFYYRSYNNTGKKDFFLGTLLGKPHLYLIK